MFPELFNQIPEILTTSLRRFSIQLLVSSSSVPDPSSANLFGSALHTCLSNTLNFPAHRSEGLQRKIAMYIQLYLRHS